MDPVVDNARASKCLGCADTVLSTSSHTCGGNRIPTKELGWYCTCPQPECRRRQQGIWPAADKRTR